MIERRIEQLEGGMAKVMKSIGDAANAKHEADQLAQQEKAKTIMIEIQSKIYDRAVAYTNLIMVGAYAGMFATWGATRAQLPAKANIVVALSLGVSLAAFILFEVYKMTYTAMKFLKNRTLLVSPAAPDVFAKKLQKLSQEEQKLSLFFMPIWVSVMVVCVGAGLFALGLLFYNYFALLIGWPTWPK
jgi:hypothetical protein